MFPSPPVIEGLGTAVGSPVGPGMISGDLPIYNVYIKPLLGVDFADLKFISVAMCETGTQQSTRCCSRFWM